MRLFALALVGSLNAYADVNDTQAERRFSLPAVRVGVVLPREDWTLSREQRRAGDTAVYYMLSSEARKMFFSVYIDKTETCRSAEACLDAAIKNPSYKDAQQLERGQHGPFHFAQFFLDKPMGAPIKQAHILASAYVDGVWFDIHISKVDKERPEPAPLLDMLKTVALK